MRKYMRQMSRASITAAMRTLNMLSEMDLLKEGVEPCVTPRLRKPGETGAIVLKGSVQAEGTG